MPQKSIIAKHYYRSSDGWYLPRHTYSVFMSAIYTQESQRLRIANFRAQNIVLGTFSPVKYNGSFLDIIPH